MESNPRQWRSRRNIKLQSYILSFKIFFLLKLLEKFKVSDFLTSYPHFLNECLCGVVVKL